MSNKKSVAEIYKNRQKHLSGYLAKNNIYAAVFRDFEGERNSCVRYFTGHPQDSVFIIFSDNETILVPWDVYLAEKYSNTDKIIPFTDFSRNFTLAVKKIIQDKAAGSLSLSKKIITVELPSCSKYFDVLKLKNELPEAEIICRQDGVGEFAESLRVIKDSYEIIALREAAEITSSIIDKLYNYVKPGNNRSETDIALFIEILAREKGAEGTGFETIAASPERSWSIHPFPSYTAARITGNGLAVIDFGIRHKGYTSDVTVTVASGNLSVRQKEMIFLVEEAALKAENFIKKGIPANSPAMEVKNFFNSRGYEMPHSLGHGIGLDVHEKPLIKDTAEENACFESGMVIAVEPGLYSPEEGGVRLENNYLVTDKGFEKLTSSRIFRFDSCGSIKTTPRCLK